ncbi:unnamed protein product [Sympodiomycopsis kandeliae]
MIKEARWASQDWLPYQELVPRRFMALHNAIEQRIDRATKANKSISYESSVALSYTTVDLSKRSAILLVDSMSQISDVLKDADQRCAAQKPSRAEEPLGEPWQEVWSRIMKPRGPGQPISVLSGR